MTAKKTSTPKKAGAYVQIIQAVFNKHYAPGLNRFVFGRNELETELVNIGLTIEGDEELTAKNIGDVIYTFRFRQNFPKPIRETAPAGKMWIIVGKGDAQYEFRLITTPALAADPGMFVAKLHDATPEIVRRFALSDEQAALARIRYNRLVDIFCKCVAHSLQNHLRTKVKGIGQIEIDELYVGANRQGEHFIIPIQAKKKRDRLGVSQLMQDLEYCRVAHPDLRPRALGAQLLKHEEGGKVFDKIVLFEFECRDEPNDVIIRKRAERHFVLLPHGEITASDFKEAADRQDEADSD
jgi:hypothetical protein